MSSYRNLMPPFLRERRNIVIGRPRVPIVLPKQKSPKAVSIGDKIIKATNVFTENPLALLVLLAAFALSVSHFQFPGESYVISIGTRLRNNNSTRVIGQYIIDNEVRAIGLIVMGAAVFSAPIAQRLTLSGVLAAWVMLSPVVDVWQYIIQAILVFLYYRPIMKNERQLILVVGFLLWYFEILFFSNPVAPTTTPPVTTRTRGA